ncbi:putative Ig domain-containing protein [Lysobacter capsici]|uniref:putative Ig domain-containing protein n=1 Tax=Lysobacter capsici TaxID=435897 RepID=UPI001BFFDC47|nr:putative Ig domain-containing protein [Lysobacter capsici]QWF18238.1 putative Ig domain-containing protein [Lysobacter capsici]
MAAVISGNGLGLFNSSASQIGMGLGGGARLGQGQDNQFVNVATGNLLLQSQDDQVLSRGMLVGFNRTYNSRGQLAQVGADAWVTGFERRVELLSGSLNSAGSVMRRHTGDGSYQDFTYAGNATYVSTTGDGAHDSLSWDAATSAWTYTEGSTRQQERYADHASATLKGRLTQLRNPLSDGAQPQVWDVLYDANGRIAEITPQAQDAYGGRLVFTYDANGRLASMASDPYSDGRALAGGRAWYSYDSAGRLASVIVDLTPRGTQPDSSGSAPDHDQWTAAAGSNDGYLFKTTYSYTDATSLLISRVEQSDGTVTSYTYDAQNRIKSVTRGDTNTNDGDGLGQTLSFSYDSATTTSVSDSSGRTWTYVYDAAGQLTEVRQPAVDGLRETTTYTYDAAGNVTRVSTKYGGLVQAQTDYAYDANGNLTWQWERVQSGSSTSARAVQRTYTANNQLASETVFTGLDADGPGAGQPSGGLTTNYLYDAQGRLRFVVNAAGEVSEQEYHTSGLGIGQLSRQRQYLGDSYGGAYTLAGLEAWATTARKANSILTTYSYPAAQGRTQRVFASVDAAGEGIETDALIYEGYRYDERGRLLLKNRTSAEGAFQTIYAYDGLGRLVSERVVEKGVTIQSRTWVYQDSQGLSHTIIEGGVVGDNDPSNDRIRSEQRDAAGRLIYVKESAVSGTSGGVRESRNYYDSTGRLRASENSGGARTYFFYDAEGQLSGQVDETGAVTEFVRDPLGRITQTKRYATRVNPASWQDGGSGEPGGPGDTGPGNPGGGTSGSTGPQSLGLFRPGAMIAGIYVYDLIEDARPATSADDRGTSTSYDALGRVVTQTDAEGAITTYSYDGANRLLHTRTTDAAGTAATARVTRYFYDAQGRQTGRLDAEGYLTEYSYDLAGRRIRSVAYATVTAAAQQANGGLNDLRPASSGNDQTTRWFYDGRGNLVATLDAEGYLTEYVHDTKHLQRASKAYALKLGGLSGNESLATLRASAAAGGVRETRISYDSAGRVIAEQNPEGTVTRYTYDAQGNPIRSEVAADTTEVREGRMRYNVFGELIGELHGEGAARVLPGMTEAQLDALYAQYGVRHSYNSLGQRSESIDAAGNKTWYFYDASGRPTFTVKGVASASGVANAQGEVVETRYNAFGEAIETTAYTGRITLATAGSRDSVASAITTLAYVAGSDSRRSVSYNHRGQVVGSVDAENAATRYTYNAFGERIREISAFGSPAALTVETDYDRRGLATARREGVGSAVARAQGWTYDAFGRVTTAVDARGIATTYSYDRLGRQLTARQTVLNREEVVSTSYDAYGRVLSVTDAMGRTTTSAYDTANRTTTVTTPEGVSVTTTFNRHGQQVNVATPLPGGTVANTSYLYDRDGNLKSTTDALGRADSNEYDARGLLSATVDRTGRRVELRYDAVGRLLQRIEDPAGLALTTTYRYDGQGRQSEVTDASGRKTAYSYDREGRLTQVALDPAGLNLRTAYTYDALGRQITVTEGAGTAQARTIQYDYDALGRRTAERLDPSGLNLITSYAYDANDNVVRRTDATGNVTRFYYDEADRMIYTVDPLGVMTRNWRDVNGRVVATRTFIIATDASTLTDTTTIAQLDGRLAWGSTDPGSYTVYDRDGRARLVLSTIGTIQEFTYDAAGRVSVIRNYAALWPDFGTTMLNKLFAGTAQLSDFNLDALRNDTATDRVRDLVTYQVFTTLGELRTTVDNAGTVISYVYDAAGRQTVHKRYAHAAQLNPTLRAKLVAGTASPQDVVDVVAVFNETDLVTYTSYDGAGRARYTVDGNGSVVEILYDSAGRPVGTRAYATAIVVNTDATFKSKLIAGDPAAMGMVRDRVAAIANDARDLRSYQVYDSAGRIAATIDGAGYVSTRSYDAAGRVVQERRHAQAATIAAPLLAKLVAGTASVADIAAVTPVNNAADAVVRHIYDAAGRERYTLVQNSASTYLVSERRYDGAGRVTAQYQYAVPIALGPVATPADVGTALNAAGAYATADRYRSTQYVFDAAGRVRFTVDDLGAVNEQRFDGAGRVVETRRYGGYISISTPMNDAAVAAAVAAIAEVRTTTTTYDAMGRVLRVTDALNQYEEYTYNPLSQVTALRNKNGHVWNYEYDAAGRRTAEISPDVWIANVDAAGTQSYGVRRVVTRTEYDALGNVTRRLEDADGARPRITRYEYDNRGNQIRTIFPDAGKIDPDSKQLVVSGIQPTIEITYDALGRAVAQKDVRGNYSYKIYDNLGRLAYDVDQENYVTAYSYDGFGQQTNLRRHAQALNIGALAGWTPGQPLSMAQMQAAAATSASDRTIATRYDQRGLAVQIEQAQIAYYTSTGAAATGSPTVRIEYDGFGNKVKESILLEGTAGQADARWADTYTYYDLVGRVTMTVDAEGYVTRARYNATGEVVESIEYAKAVWTGGLSTAAPPALPSAGDEISGYDRITRLGFDALGRKISESVVRHFQRNDGSSGVRDVVTQFRYDGADRVTQIINDAGTTSTEYDALGHAVSVTEPTRKVINDGTFGILAQNTGYDLNHPNVYADASPYTGMIYDAFGNLVLTRRFASGKNAAGQVVEDANKDQIERVRYDWQGRAVATSATNGDTAYTDYDAADNVSHRWYVLSGTQASRDVRVHTWYSYDKAGRQTGVGQTRDLINGGGSSTDLSEAVVYNAFGEIVQKTYAGLQGSLNYAYDAAGRLITSNENFGARNFGYNLAGHQVREPHVVVISDGQTGGGRQSVDATTFNTTDRLGRTTATRLPSNTTDPNATLSVQQRLDRWGNVLEVIDARGYQTNYRYNESNQVTRDERPLVEVVSDTGQSSWLRPINYWFYDALGRLIGTRDANGNTRTNQYDAVGRMVSSKDALGQATLFAYDALGNQRITQNPLGYLTYKDYDALGRLVEIGDYLANGAGGRTRTALQRYWLNQNGDRIVVTDALNKQALYDFDSRHLLLRSQTAAGVVTGYAYDVQGRKILETNARSGSSTLTDRDGESVRVDELSWNYDVYGRLIDHNNLSGRDFDYAYDPITGQLTAESQSGGPAAYSYRFTTYYADGRVKALHENGAAPTYRYEYDAAGNRTVEEVNTTDGGGLAVRTVTRTWYDSQNRIARVVQDDLASGKRVFDMSYSYDAVGNRRRVKAAAAYGPDAGGIEVTNNAPTVTQAPAPRSLRRGMTSQFTLLFSDIFRDAEQDPLTLQITLADGSALPAWLSVQRDASTGRITFTANPPANLPDQALTIRLTAYETHQPTKQIATSFSLSVSANARPQRHNDAVETIRIKTGQAWNKDLLATDLFYDLDVGDRLRLSLDNPGAVPAWMSLDANNPGALRLSGVAQTGTYTFTVRATDEMGGAEIKTVQIIVAPNNAPGGPAPLPPKTAMVGRDFNWSLGVSAAFSDADGDPLEIVASGLPAWMTFQRVRIQGRDEIRLIGRVPDSAVGGTNYTIAFTATDPEGASRTTTLSVTLRSGNSNPTAPASIYPPPAVIGHYYWYQLPAFTDADGDAMTYGVVPYAVANLPPGLSFDAATRTISGTLTQASSEPLNVIYIATDEYGGRTATSFVLHTRGNAAPVASSIPNQSAGVGVNWSYSLPPFSDANYDPVSYTATGLPPGLWLNANAQIVGTPSTAGSYGVTVVGTDPYGASASTYFVITVNAAPPPNRAPQINPARPIPGGEFYSTNRWLVERQDMSFPGDIFIDPDGNPLTYSFVELPGWLSYSYSPQYGHILGGYPPGQTITERIIMRAQDPSGAYVDLTFYVHTTYDHYDPGNPTDPTSLPNPVSVVAADANTFEMGASVLAESGAETSSEQLQSPAANTMSATAAAASAGPVPTQVKEFWYTYDAENRIKINNGQMVNGQIQLVSYGEDSYELVYDAGGRAVTRINLRPSGGPGVYNLWLERFDFDLRGNRTVEYWEQVIGPPETRENGVRKVLTYDANNRLTGTRSYFGASEFWDHTSGDTENDEFYQRFYYGGWLMSSEDYLYDADGRLMYQETRQRNTSQPDWVRFAGGDQITNLGVLELESNADYRLPADGSVTSGYDAAGRLMRYSISGKGYIHTYTSTYVGWESYLQGSVTGTSSDNNYRTTTNTLSYDAFGRLMSQREVTPLKNGSIDDRMRYYGYNGDGSVQTRREGSLSNNVFTQNGEFGPGNYLLVHAGGQQQAELKQGFAIARADQTLYYTDQIQSLSGRGNYEAGGGNLVSAVPGETLREMAKRVYGSDQMWYVLANANGLGNPDQELAAGTQLIAPNATVSGNDANTFKPYNPADAIGSTTPSLPYIPPPPKGHCGAVGMILAVVAMIVVAIVAPYIAPVVQGFLGTGALAAGVTMGLAVAAGSAVSQGIGSVMGVSSFSWRQVAADGITAGITAGVGSYLQTLPALSKINSAGRMVNTGLGRVASGVLNYGASVVGKAVTGQSTDFSWKNIAATAITAYVTEPVLQRTPQIRGRGAIKGILNQTARGFADSAVQATTQRLMGEGKQDWGRMLVDAFGNALANAAVTGMINSYKRGVGQDQAKSFLERYPYATAASDGSTNRLGPPDIMSTDGARLEIMEVDGPLAKTAEDLAMFGQMQHEIDQIRAAGEDVSSYEARLDALMGASKADRVAKLNALFDQPLGPNISYEELAALEKDYAPIFNGQLDESIPKLETITVTAPPNPTYLGISAPWVNAYSDNRSAAPVMVTAPQAVSTFGLSNTIQDQQFGKDFYTKWNAIAESSPYLSESIGVQSAPTTLRDVMEKVVALRAATKGALQVVNNAASVAVTVSEFSTNRVQLTNTILINPNPTHTRPAVTAIMSAGRVSEIQAGTSVRINVSELNTSQGRMTNTVYVNPNATGNRPVVTGIMSNGKVSPLRPAVITTATATIANAKLPLGTIARMGLVEGAKSAPLLSVLGTGLQYGLANYYGNDKGVKGVNEGGDTVRDFAADAYLDLNKAIVSGATGAAAGAFIGSMVPGFGTAIGFGVGFGVGILTSVAIEKGYTWAGSRDAYKGR